MEMIPVENSSRIESIGYSPESETMRIKFKKNGGPTYEYNNVPQSVYEGLRDAESPGRYFDAHIRGQWEGRRLDDVVVQAASA